MNIYQKEIVSRIISIIFTITFLIGSSFLWKRMHDNYNYAYSFLDNDKQVLLVENVPFSTDLNSNNLYGYNFKISSNYNENKKYNVKLVSDNINLEDIHYTIDGSEILTLNSDGLIIEKNILANEEHNYLLKIWLVNNYSNNDINLIIDFM